MPHQMLFLQGAGEGAYKEDALLVERLRLALGDDYEVTYPAMADDGDAPYDAWKIRIDQALAELVGPVILVGHSVGGSVLAKYVAEMPDQSQIAGVCLLASPFWGGDGWRYDGYEDLEVPQALVTKSPAPPMFLFHCRDDETVPVDHLTLYQRRFPEAASRVLDDGGHQFDTELTPIAGDIQGRGTP